MTPAFWDTSALVPLCVQQQPSSAVRLLLQRYAIAVWWSTSVEMRSAFERLLRTGHLSPLEYAAAGVRLERLRPAWRELQPAEALKHRAEALLISYPLKAADALQLAAAWTWCSGQLERCTFIAGDAQLLAAARLVGFQVIALPS